MPRLGGTGVEMCTLSEPFDGSTVSESMLM
jgi:hypothetical protein